MTTTQSNPPPPGFYPAATLERAERAARCAPFCQPLYETMRWEGVALMAVVGSAGTQNQYTRRTLSEFAVERELLWLIQVGMLRREVDGQGLTDSFRLTPLGRQLLDRWQRRPVLAATWGDRLLNWLAQWRHRLSWLK
ncbi:MAG: hypothetical protein KME20_15890 [Kaiparowitsia implicata GSE-PSE-MK54-09C]|jgi:hypothetical protein|nr:hypothetical protein [Kaiparowitsia implicata GSE-PSE-MK54-09C]